MHKGPSDLWLLFKLYLEKISDKNRLQTFANAKGGWIQDSRFKILKKFLNPAPLDSRFKIQDFKKVVESSPPWIQDSRFKILKKFLNPAPLDSRFKIQDFKKVLESSPPWIQDSRFKILKKFLNPASQA